MQRYRPPRAFLTLMPRLATLSLVAACFAGASPCQEGLEGEVARLLERADAAKLERVWEISQEISELEGQDDALARAIAKGTDGLGRQARLAAARALIDLSSGAAFGKEILATLQPLCSDRDTEVRAAALGLLGTDGVFNSRLLPEVQVLLKENATSEVVPPQARIEAAKGLWRIGNQDQRSQAREVLNQFLRSTDRQLEIQGALALAEINADSSNPAWRVLRRIQDEPTPEGRLARSYLRLDTERRRFEHLLQRGFEAGSEAASGGRFEKLSEIMARIRAQHTRGTTFTDEFMIENAARGMLRAVDRHSAYFSSDEYKAFFFDLNREYGGIGAFVNFDRDEVFSIVRPIYSGPAYRAGLRSGDKILEVDGWETQGHTSEEIIAKLKGKPNTNVTVRIYRPGMEEPELVEVVREQIQVPSVNSELLPGNIGYVELVTFGANTSEELERALLEFKEKGVEGVVLDVRSNTGGYLLAARDVVELFVPGRQRVVYTESRAGTEEDLYTRDRAVLPDVPLVVLANEYSASASEIVAGALQDLKRATVVGKRTYGKGSVQTLIPLHSDRGEPFDDQNDNGLRDEWESFTDVNKNGEYDIGPRMKLTVARYFLPSGRTPNREVDEDGQVVDPDWGIVPDREVEMYEYDPADAWMVEALRPLVKEGVFEAYVKKVVAEHADLLPELAVCDGDDESRYPGFDEFYAGLDTKLPRDEVRRWVRLRVREVVADMRGRAFVGTRRMGDFQEDAQLQEALRVVMEQRGRDIRAMEPYASVWKVPAPATADAADPAAKR
jgi:carboxyl-terminal processing protease